MWARDMEIALGAWLALSLFVFGHAGDRTLVANDLACAALVATLALCAYWRPLSRIHLAELAVAAWLAGYGWRSAFLEPTPAAQNHIVVGLLLAMFAIVPSRASEPPSGWRTPNRS